MALSVISCFNLDTKPSTMGEEEVEEEEEDDDDDDDADSPLDFLFGGLELILKERKLFTT